MKAHSNHIYRKFNIHSKSELFELLNDVEKPVRKDRRSSSSAWEDEERQAGEGRNRLRMQERLLGEGLPRSRSLLLRA